MRRMGSSEVAEKLLADGRFVNAERSKIRQARRVKFALLLMVVLPLAFAVVAGHVYVISLSTGATPPEPLSGGFFTTLYRDVAGQLDPSIALTAVLTAVAVCAMINVALAVDNGLGDLRTQAVISEWRASLGQVASVMSAGALVTGLAVWANLGSGSGHDTGTAVATTLFAGVTVWLGLTAREQVNDADRATSYADAVDNRAALGTWESELARRKVPRPLGALRAEDRDAVRQRSLRRCWRWLGKLALLEALYVALLATVAIVIARRHLFAPAPHPLWEVAASLAVLVVLQIGLAVTWSVLVGAAARARWSSYGAKWVRWRLDIKPRLAVGGAIAIGALMVASAWIDSGTVAGLLCVGWLLPAAVIWGALKAARCWPTIGVLSVATQPLWELIDLSLHDAHTRNKETATRIIDEAIETLGHCGDDVTPHRTRRQRLLRPFWRIEPSAAPRADSGPHARHRRRIHKSRLP